MTDNNNQSTVFDADPVNEPAVSTSNSAPTLTTYANANPNTDLNYNAFLRGYGMDSAQAQAQAARSSAQLNAQYQAQQPIFEQQLQDGLTDSLEGQANRGNARSSARLLSQDKVQSSVANQQAAFAAGINDKQANVSASLQDSLMSLGRQKSEAEQQARINVAQQQNKQAAMEQALRDLGLL